MQGQIKNNAMFNWVPLNHRQPKHSDLVLFFKENDELDHTSIE